MRVIVRKRYVVAAVVCAVALLGAVTVVFGLTRGDGEVPGAFPDGHAEVRLGGRPFRIDGDAAKPLSPGRSATINVRFTNPRNSPLRVTRLRVWVRAVSAPNADEHHPCWRRDFAVRQARPGFAVSVAARATRSLRGLGVPRGSWPQVRMVNRPVNQDGCKGASITLGYRGSGSLRR